MKKYFPLTVLAALSSLHITQNADAEISANVALTSDYVTRGISQNDEDLALQGGFDFKHNSGFYIGVWGSNVNFGGASTELDVYGGWATEFENGVGLDVGLLYYTYHGSSSASKNNFKEAYLGLSHSGFSAKYSFGDELDDHWQVGYEHNFEKVSLSGTYGDFDAYSYYRVGVSGELGGLGWALNFWDTDSTAERVAGDLAGDRFVLTISKDF